MRKSPLLLSLLLAGCVATWPPVASAQVKPQQSGTGAINTATDDAALSGSGAGIADVTVEAPLEDTGGASTPAIGVIDDGIGADKLAEESVGTSELAEDADTPAADECLKVASDTSKVKYEVCTIGQMVV